MGKPVLVIMAAGIGKRYGSLKQVDPVGECGQTLMEYSLYDAKRAGFEKVLFIISANMQRDFSAYIEKRIGNALQVDTVVQSLQDIPPGFSIPEDRAKPWGTGHAVLAARKLIHSPFVAINADDYYGPSSFVTIYNFLTNLDQQPENTYAMVGYQLVNTLSPNGFVSRGICQTGTDGQLHSIKERTHIISTCDGPLFTEDGDRYERLSGDTIASMNFWGLTESFLGELEARFASFLQEALHNNPLGAEYFLPDVIGQIVRDGSASVKVLQCDEKWYGMTYPEDRAVVVDAIRDMTNKGIYPECFWG